MERSALLLELFCPGYDAWLTKNPWDGIPEYEEAKMAIRAIVPVNDPRERLYAVVCSYLPSINDLFDKTSQAQFIEISQGSRIIFCKHFGCPNEEERSLKERLIPYLFSIQLSELLHFKNCYIHF